MRRVFHNKFPLKAFCNNNKNVCNSSKYVKFINFRVIMSPLNWQLLVISFKEKLVNDVNENNVQLQIMKGSMCVNELMRIEGDQFMIYVSISASS